MDFEVPEPKTFTLSPSLIKLQTVRAGFVFFNEACKVPSAIEDGSPRGG